MKNVLNYELARLWYCQTHRWILVLVAGLLVGYLGVMSYLNDQYDLNRNLHLKQVETRLSSMEENPGNQYAKSKLVLYRIDPNKWETEYEYLKIMQGIPEGSNLEENITGRLKELKARIKAKIPYHPPYAFIKTILLEKWLAYCLLPSLGLVGAAWYLILLGDKGKIRVIDPHTHGQILRAKILVGLLVCSAYILLPAVILWLIGQNVADLVFHSQQIMNTHQYIIYVFTLLVGMVAGLMGLADQRSEVSLVLGMMFVVLIFYLGYAWFGLLGIGLLLLRLLLSRF